MIYLVEGATEEESTARGRDSRNNSFMFPQTEGQNSGVVFHAEMRVPLGTLASQCTCPSFLLLCNLGGGLGPCPPPQAGLLAPLTCSGPTKEWTEDKVRSFSLFLFLSFFSFFLSFCLCLSVSLSNKIDLNIGGFSFSIYIFERKRYREREIFHSLLHSPDGDNYQSGRGRSEEPGAASGTWGRPLLSQHTDRERNPRGAPGSQTSTRVRCHHCGQRLICYATTVAP